jgi:hypothetical protein
LPDNHFFKLMKKGLLMREIEKIKRKLELIKCPNLTCPFYFMKNENFEKESICPICLKSFTIKWLNGKFTASLNYRHFTNIEYLMKFVTWRNCSISDALINDRIVKWGSDYSVSFFAQFLYSNFWWYRNNFIMSPIYNH